MTEQEQAEKPHVARCAEGQHAWVKRGRCYHSHTTGGNDWSHFECTTCGAWAHAKRPSSFACGAKRRTLKEMETIIEAEAKLCPVITWHAALAAREAGRGTP